MNSYQSYKTANNIIQIIDQRVWQKIAQKTIHKYVPFNIKKLNTHNIQSFVFMNSKPISQLNQIKDNIQNKQTLIQTIAKNRIQSKRLKTDIINETPQKLQSHQQKHQRKQITKSNLKRKQTFKSQEKQAKSSLRTSKGIIVNNQFKSIQQPHTIDYGQQVLRAKKISQQQSVLQQKRRGQQAISNRLQSYKLARDKFKSAHSQIAYDFDGNFYGKRGTGILNNEKLFQLKPNYGQNEIMNRNVIEPIKKILKNQALQQRNRQSEDLQMEKAKKNKKLKTATAQQFMDSFKDQTLSEGVKIGQISSNIWKQNKLLQKKKFRNLKQYQNSSKVQKFKQFKYPIINKTQKMKIKTVQAQFTGRKVQTLQVMPNKKLLPLKDKLSFGQRKMKTMFNTQQQSLQRFSKFSNISKLNGSQTTKNARRGLITIGNPYLYEQVISQK